MSKQILILCEAIAPPAFTPRVLTLAQYLQHQGWQCTILTEECEQQAFNTDICPIYQMPAYHNLLADKLFYAKDQALYRYAVAHLDMSRFDLIFCSTYYYFPLLAAKQLAQRYHLPLVVDLRDIAEQWGNQPYFTRRLTPCKVLDYCIGKLYERKQLRLRNRILRFANAVTSVSPWHQQLLAQYNPHTYLIYNGYDEQHFVAKDVKTPFFQIAYLGKLYSTSLRDPRLLFAALQSLLAQGLIDPQLLRVRFHIDPDGQAQLHQLLQSYNLNQVIDIQGYIPRSEILDVMHQSSVLLVLTTQSTPQGTHGIMGTKFFENIGVEKPVLCVRSDEECLAQVIAQTNAGLAATTVEEVEHFLLNKYNEWLRNGYTRQAVTNKHLFSRQHQAEQFIQIFNRITV
jgi:glycosyltransferase involved in cell wall biosynthesis